MQGFGNVGGIAAQELVDRGATVVAVSDVSGGVHDPAGLDIPTMSAYAMEHGSLEGWETGRRITNEELLELECDILVLAAREDQLHARQRAAPPLPHDRRGRERPDLARGRRDPARARDPVLPDILTNAGGVTVSYFEWVQDLGRLFWGRDEIRAKLAEKLNDAFDRVWEISNERAISMRTAALVAGIRDVGSALEARGLYPDDERRARRPASATR